MKTDHLGQRWNPKKNKKHRRVRPVKHPGNIVKEVWETVPVLDDKGKPTFRDNGQPRMKRQRKLLK